MTGPIQGVNLVDALGVATTGEAQSPPATANTQQTSSPTVDSADVARAEALLATITQAAAAVPPVDPARVAALKQAVNSGIYAANPHQIAEK
jgi:flagellar biosynthesis anti-sigma factor FlgM